MADNPHQTSTGDPLQSAESFGAQQYSFFGALGNDGGLGGSLDGAIEDGLEGFPEDDDDGLFDGPDAMDEPDLDLIAEDAEDLSMLGFATSSAAAAAASAAHSPPQHQQQQQRLGNPPSMLGAMTLSELEAATEAVSMHDPFMSQHHLRLMQQQPQQQPYMQTPSPSFAHQHRQSPGGAFGSPAAPIDSNALEAMMLGEADRGLLSVTPPRPQPLPIGTNHPLSLQQQQQHQAEQYHLLQAFSPQQYGQQQQHTPPQAPGYMGLWPGGLTGGSMGPAAAGSLSAFPQSSPQTGGPWGQPMSPDPAARNGPAPGQQQSPFPLQQAHLSFQQQHQQGFAHGMPPPPPPQHPTSPGQLFAPGFALREGQQFGGPMGPALGQDPFRQAPPFVQLSHQQQQQQQHFPGQSTSQQQPCQSLQQPHQQQQHGMEGEQSSAMHPPVNFKFPSPGPPQPPTQPFPRQLEGNFQAQGSIPTRGPHPPQQQQQHPSGPPGPSPPLSPYPGQGGYAAQRGPAQGQHQGQAPGNTVGNRPQLNAGGSNARGGPPQAGGPGSYNNTSSSFGQGYGTQHQNRQSGQGSFNTTEQRAPYQMTNPGRGGRDGASHMGGRGEWSIRKGAGWMSGPEIDLVMSSLLYGISTGEPYVEDYYYQAFVNKHAGARNARIFAPNNLRDFTKELAHLDPSASAQFVKVEGLGKIVYGNLKAPRVLMDLTGNSEPGSLAAASQPTELHPTANTSDAASRAGRRLNQDPHFAARILIEDCLNLLLDVDDIDRSAATFTARIGYHYVTNPDAVELHRRRGVLLSGIASSFRLPPTPHTLPAETSNADTAMTDPAAPPAHSDGVFLRIMTLVKGRDLLARVLRVLRPAPLLAGEPSDSANTQADIAGPSGQDRANPNQNMRLSSTLEKQEKRSPGAALLAEGCDPLHLLWATLRSACHLFGTSLQSLDAANEATMSDTSSRIVSGARVALSRLETQQQICDCLAAFIGGCRAHEALAPSDASALEIALLPLALTRQTELAVPAAASGGLDVTPPVSSEWLGEILAELLNRAAALGLGEDCSESDAERTAKMAANTGPTHVAWRVWCDALFVLLVRHLEALHSIREAAWGAANEEAIRVVLALACQPLMAAMLPHVQQEQRLQLANLMGPFIN